MLIVKLPDLTFYKIYMMILRHKFMIFASKRMNQFAFSLDNGQPPDLPPFKPEDHGLRPDFILTNFTKMKG